MDEPRMIECVGYDNKLHVCLPESEVCKCGMKVRRKKLLPHDHTLFSCYACTY